MLLNSWRSTESNWIILRSRVQWLSDSIICQKVHLNLPRYRAILLPKRRDIISLYESWQRKKTVVVWQTVGLKAPCPAENYLGHPKISGCIGQEQRSKEEEFPCTQAAFAARIFPWSLCVFIVHVASGGAILLFLSSFPFLQQESIKTKDLLHRGVSAQLLSKGRSAMPCFESAIKSPRRSTQFIVQDTPKPAAFLSTRGNGDALLRYRRSKDSRAWIVLDSKRKAGYWQITLWDSCFEKD